MLFSMQSVWSSAHKLVRPILHVWMLFIFRRLCAGLNWCSRQTAQAFHKISLPHVSVWLLLSVHYAAADNRAKKPIESSLSPTWEEKVNSIIWKVLVMNRKIIQQPTSTITSGQEEEMSGGSPMHFPLEFGIIKKIIPVRQQYYRDKYTGPKDMCIIAWHIIIKKGWKCQKPTTFPSQRHR